MSFDSFNLDPALLRAVAEINYTTPTAIQRDAIPAVLSGRDVWARAQTGSGKTAAYGLPLLQRMARARVAREGTARALILSPTRELAMQIGESLRAYSRYLPTPLKVLSVFGGLSINPQMMALRGGADILIATPGRLLDLVDHNALNLKGVECVVLDEADRLLEGQFAQELHRTLEMLPARRQSLLFSATFPAEVHALALQVLRDPVQIDVPQAEVRIIERVIQVDAEHRTQLLRHLIATQRWERVLVFVATKYATEHVAEKLRRANINATALHGELSQWARIVALSEFKSGAMQVIVATDLASRGIDVAELPAVVNYDLPRSTDDYVHRIGRTARAGAAGVAVSFVDSSSEAHFRLIEKRRGVRIAREQVEGFTFTELPTSKPQGNGGIKGKRKSKKDKAREKKELSQRR